MKKLLQLTAFFCCYLLFVNSSIAQGTTYYWVGGGGEWGDLSHWSSSSGGLGSAFGYPPSPLDNVVFDQNSGFTPTNKTVTTPSYSGITVKDMTWNNAPNNPIFEENATTDFVLLGNLTLQQGLTFRAQILMMGDQNVSITSNGAKIGGNLYIDKENATVSLNDSLMLYYISTENARSGAIILSRGTLNTNGHSLYANGFIMYGANACHFNFANSKLIFKDQSIGAGNFYVNYYNTAGSLIQVYTSFRIEGTNKTINAANSHIYFKRTLDGMVISNGVSYTLNKITYLEGLNSYSSGQNVYQYTGYSNYGPAKISKIYLKERSYQALHFTNGAVVDTIIHGDAANYAPEYYWGAKRIVATGTTFKYIKFQGNYAAGFNYNNNYTYFRTGDNNSSSSSYPVTSTFTNCTIDSLLYSLNQVTEVNNVTSMSCSNTTIKAVVSNLNIVHDANSNSNISYFYAGNKATLTYNNSRLVKSYFKKESTLGGSGSTMTNTYFDGIGRVSTQNSTYRFLEYNINGWMEGTGNTIDTLVFSPGYTYRFGNGVTNTVTRKWYASGNPCYFTEVYNAGSSGTATINLSAGVSNEFDYIRFWGVKAAGAAAPIHAGVRSVNIANNSGINFSTYNGLALLYPFGTNQEVRCHNSYPFTLNTNGFYGNTNTTYTWQDGSTLDHFVVNGPGTYTAHAYYGRNCYYSASYTVVDRLAANIDTITSANISCDPLNPAGDLTVATSGGGSGPYTYQWTNHPSVVGSPILATTPTMENQAPGFYQVQIADATGCTVSAVGEIKGPNDKLNVTTEIFNDCNPSPTVGTGFIQAKVTGGIPPYSYEWLELPGNTNSYAEHLEGGTYQLVVTDSLGCQSDVISIVVGNSIGTLQVSVATVQPTGCDLTGSAEVVIQSNSVATTFNWSHDNSIHTQNAQLIPIGTHNVLTVDENSCAELTTFTITSPDNVAPVFNYCPGNISLQTAGSCGRVATWTAPTAADITDDCSFGAILSNHNPGEIFPVGSTDVIYRVKDQFGNERTCQFVVTVVDLEKPHFVNCINDIVIQANVGNCTATASWPTPVAIDNCGIQSLTADFASGTAFPIGVTTVTYTAKDFSNNTEICTFRVIVKSNANDFRFTSSCPSNTTVYTPNVANSCQVNYQLPAINFSSFCTNATYLQGNNNYVPGATVPLTVGSHLISYKLTNVADTLTCQYTVNVRDNSSPTYAFSPGFNYYYLYVNADTCGGYKANFNDPIWSDNCGIDSTYRNFTNGTVYPPGSSNYLEFYARDVNGNVGYAYINMYVNQNPTYQVTNCPSSITVAENTCGGAIVNWTPPTIDHKCYSVTSDYSPGHLFGIGTTVVTYTFTTDAGAVASCSFSVTVNPTITSVSGCPSNISQTIAGTDCTKSVMWNPPVFNTPCQVLNVTSSHQPGDYFPVGITTVNYVATLTDNSTMTCSFTVTLSNPNVQVPYVTDCPQSVTIHTNTDVSCTEAPVYFTEPIFNAGSCPSLIDHVSYTPTTFSQGDLLSIGTHNFVYTAYTANNDPVGVCAFNVIVVDTTSRVVIDNCPINIVVPVNPSVSCNSAVVNFATPTFTSQGCTADVDHLTHTINTGALLNIGTHFNQSRAYDVNNNLLASCNFSITVIDTTTQLQVECPGEGTGNYRRLYAVIDPSTCMANPTWSAPVVLSSGGCSGIYSYTTQLSGISSGTAISVNNSYQDLNVAYGIYNTTNQLMANCNMNIILVLADSILPREMDTTIYISASDCKSPFLWQNPVATNNCFSASIGINSYSNDWVTHNLTPYNTTSVQRFPVGEYKVHYYVNLSNSGYYVSYTLHVVDGGLPDFGTSCPTDTVKLYTSFNQCEAVANWPTPVAISGTCNSPIYTTVVSNVNSGTVLPIGDTVVTYTAYHNEMSVSCSFVASVVDTIRPSIYVCPSNVIAYADSGCEAVVNWSQPSVFDNCAGTTSIADIPNGSTFGIGTTLVTYTVTDASNNINTCQFNVTVIDTIAPTFNNCPSNITANSVNGLCAGTATWIVPTAVDNCSSASVISNYNSGDNMPIGTTTVNYTAIDSVGNTNTCSFNVTIIDVDKPSLNNCPSDITVNANHNICAANVVWSAPTANDPCGNSVITSTHLSGSIFDVGVTKVTYYIRDNAGNIDSCSFNVTVTDVSAPQITACPPNQTVELKFNECLAPATWTTPIALDNCSGVTLTGTHTSGDQFPIGTTVVSYLAVDDQGLQDVCTFSITVLDPKFFCGGSIVPSTPIIVPNAFTPDGDGVNDVLVIEGIEDYPDNEFFIFNRWGTEVYHVYGYANQFSGKINVGKGLEGSELPTGTYYYVLDSGDKAVGVIKGFVYLQR